MFLFSVDNANTIFILVTLVIRKKFTSISNSNVIHS
jgi:hypothetical protein